MSEIASIDGDARSNSEPHPQAGSGAAALAIPQALQEQTQQEAPKQLDRRRPEPLPYALHEVEQEREHQQELSLDDEPAVATSYWPMFWSSVQAALLTVVAEFLFTIYIALQRGIGVELRLWKNVLPYMAMQTSRPIFESIIRWASIATGITLAIFAIMAFVRRRRLQVQAGRSFAWLDIALIGALGLSRSWWFDIALQPARWMYAMVLIGLVGLVVSLTLVNIDYNDREEFVDEDLDQDPDQDLETAASRSESV